MFKTLISFTLCSLLTASIAVAEGGPNRASLTFFPHNIHQKNLNGCIDCHGAKGPGPIVQFGEKWAHDTCMGCHNKKKGGPTECFGCHTNI